MQWLAWRGATVAIPPFHSPNWDLIAELNGELLRVQVKSCAFFRKRWEVALCTHGGNQSWTGLVKRLDPSRYDYLFVLVADGRRWFIPSSAVGGGRHISLGGPKYADFEVERGDPLPLEHAEVAPLESNSLRRGDARAVKGSAL